MSWVVIKTATGDLNEKEVTKTKDRKASNILDLIPRKTLNKWDRWNCRMNSPVFLSSSPEVVVYLKNEDGSEIKVEFSLQEGVETTIL